MFECTPHGPGLYALYVVVDARQPLASNVHMVQCWFNKGMFQPKFGPTSPTESHG
jgi:hypothetical protein